MAIGMSDSNNNFCNRTKCSEGQPINGNDSAANGNERSDLLDIPFGGLSLRFQSELSVGNSNQLMDSLATLRKSIHGFAQSAHDRLLSNGLQSDNSWHSDNTWDANNNWNSDNAPTDWPDMSSHKTEPEVKQGMRAIRKNCDSDVVYDTDNGQKDWYNTFFEQTRRFEQMNARSERHVHFADEPDSDQTSNYNFVSQKTRSSRNESSINGFDIQNDFNDNTDNDRNGKSNGSDNTFGSSRFPRLQSSKGSIMDNFCSGFLKPVANNLRQDQQYMRHQWTQNMTNIQNTINNSTIFGGDSIWGNGSNPSNSIFRFFGANSESEGKSKLQNPLASVRKSTSKTVVPNYTWSGQLPRRIRTKTPVYSCKVFLGGIPYDLTDSDLHCTFAQFGHIQIQWPGKDIRSAIEGAAANKAGYVYIIFENYDNVSALLGSCTISYRDLDSGCRWYYSISSRRQKAKEVQVIPFDIGDRFFMKSSFSGQMDHSRTVFVGALHGMLAADGLAKVMDDLFGGVIYAGLDTDKYKYPLGSGRVSFDNQDSYQKAVSAAFVEIKCARFKKKIQIDPYIESESHCVVCRQHIQNPIYCREEGIYFCSKCWETHHSESESADHRPIVKNKSSKT